MTAIPEQSAEPGSSRVHASEGPESTRAPLRALAVQLHDGLAQDLLAARLGVDELLADSQLGPQARQQLQRLAARLDGSASELRGLMARLSQSGSKSVWDWLDDGAGGSVVDQVARRVDEFTSRVGLEVDLRCYGSWDDPEGPGADLLVRTVREGLTNAAKHSCADRVQIVIRSGRAWWTAQVDDDGMGEDGQIRRAMKEIGAARFGIPSLADEASRLGGRLWVAEASQLGGISLGVAVPVAR